MQLLAGEETMLDLLGLEWGQSLCHTPLMVENE